MGEKTKKEVVQTPLVTYSFNTGEVIKARSHKEAIEKLKKLKQEDKNE